MFPLSGGLASSRRTSLAHQYLFTPFDRAIGHFGRYSRHSLEAVAPAGLKCEKLRVPGFGGLLSLANHLFLRSAMPSAAQIRTSAAGTALTGFCSRTHLSRKTCGRSWAPMPDGSALPDLRGGFERTTVRPRRRRCLS